LFRDGLAHLMFETGVIPHKKVACSFVDNHFNFTEAKSEWKEMQIIFKISKKGD